jgi:hypothetical protein
VLFPIALKPGVVQTGNESDSAGRYSDTQLAGWTLEGKLRPWGGWALHSASAAALTGKARALLAWRANTGTRWLAAGTNSKLYVVAEAGTVSDITPIRLTFTLSGATDIAVTDTSHDIVVTHVAHGAVVGDYVTLSGAVAVGGITALQLNVTHLITAVTADTWTATTAGTATSTTTGGGAAVVAKYQITRGLEDATANTGYGAGPYGVGPYGTPRPDTGARLPPAVWTLDNWGQNLVGVSDFNGKVYEWTLDPATPAALLTNAPTGVGSIVVTPERALMALKGRNVSWSDIGDNTDWTPSDTNQAGDLDLQTTGNLMCGRPMRGQTLILSTVDAWAAVYIGSPGVYAFTRVGQGCGVISRQAMVVTDTQAVWMGTDGFYGFDGSVQPIPCEVRSAVFGNLNAVQQAKVTAVHLIETSEVIWFFPSATSIENDRYVKLNYGLLARGQLCWDVGTLSRLAGAPKGAFDFPLMVDADGYIYEHNYGYVYGDETPYAKSGPFMLGKGDRLMQVQRIVPDESTDEVVTVSFEGKGYPGDTATSYGPYTMDDPTDVMFQARIVTMTFTGNTLADWRVGQFMLDVIPGDPLL